MTDFLSPRLEAHLEALIKFFNKSQDPNPNPIYRYAETADRNLHALLRNLSNDFYSVVGNIFYSESLRPIKNASTTDIQDAVLKEISIKWKDLRRTFQDSGFDERTMNACMLKAAQAFMYTVDKARGHGWDRDYDHDMVGPALIAVAIHLDPRLEFFIDGRLGEPVMFPSQIMEADTPKLSP